MKQRISKLITEAVESYRRANLNRKTVATMSPRWKRACEMQMDRAAGALDVLFELDPENPAWKNTGWIH